MCFVICMYFDVVSYLGCLWGERRDINQIDNQYDSTETTNKNFGQNKPEFAGFGYHSKSQPF